jgi:hypothetical protein
MQEIQIMALREILDAQEELIELLVQILLDNCHLSGPELSDELEASEDFEAPLVAFLQSKLVRRN